VKSTGLNTALKQMVRLLILGLNCLIFSAFPAHAQGNYCTSKGYFVYTTRLWGVHSPTQQVLHVLRLSHGIRQVGELAIQDFTVHVLNCEPDRVEIAGYGRGWLRYAIDISQPGNFRVVELVEETMEQHPFIRGQNAGVPSLKWEGQKEAEVLASDDPVRKYWLVFMHSSKGNQHKYRTEIRQVDSSGKTLQRLVLYQDQYTEYPD
jgi:hypothetical protein